MKRLRGTAQYALCVACASAVLMLAATGCAPHAPSEREREEQAPPVEVEFTWSADVDCSACHADEATSMVTAGYPAAVHEAEGESCASCHADDTALASAHEGALPSSAMPKRLVKTKVDEGLCLSCHNLEELAAKTAESTVLADSQGLVENPHALPQTENHAAIACADCHKMHSSEAVADTAKAQCLSCHHENVFECNTCHEEM
ncbi:cytochrome c3 family protein [Raoultibacter phocaeensis]|uniref:cytochrome c3 family protein n=1 Tax=Raoultibacter phocaeensis TaxID=2479841 RepID=UPI001118FAF9|nr:cytochrome c3 family protein [Raoultibacter phocaeensis]